MILNAKYCDKSTVVQILTKSFDDNKSFNYIVRQNRNRVYFIEKIFEHFFELCYSFGKVYLSDDKTGCALVLLPDKKKLN